MGREKQKPTYHEILGCVYFISLPRKVHFTPVPLVIRSKTLHQMQHSPSLKFVGVLATPLESQGGTVYLIANKWKTHVGNPSTDTQSTLPACKIYFQEGCLSKMKTLKTPTCDFFYIGFFFIFSKVKNVLWNKKKIKGLNM